MIDYLPSALKLAAFCAWAKKHFDVGKTDESCESTECDGEFGEMVSYMEEKGVRLLGEGNFSAVFEHGSCPGLVVKVCYQPDKDTALTYLAYARANPGPHLPRVHHLKRGNGYFVAVLDKLEPVDDDNWNGHAISEWSRRMEDTSPVCLALQAVKKFFEGAAKIDLHRENVMQDSEGNVVLTDPVSFCQSRELCTGIERAYGVADEDV